MLGDKLHRLFNRLIVTHMVPLVHKYVDVKDRYLNNSKMLRKSKKKPSAYKSQLKTYQSLCVLYVFDDCLQSFGNTLLLIEPLRV